MKLYEKYTALRDHFEVLAIHDTRAKTFEELDEKLAAVSEKRWGGKTLPFPILLDATGKTVRAYGIAGWPTHVLLDPEGRVVKAARPEEVLAEKLHELAPHEPEEEPTKDAEAPEKKDDGEGESGK